MTFQEELDAKIARLILLAKNMDDKALMDLASGMNDRLFAIMQVVGDQMIFERLSTKGRGELRWYHVAEPYQQIVLVYAHVLAINPNDLALHLMDEAKKALRQPAQ